MLTAIACVIGFFGLLKFAMSWSNYMYEDYTHEDGVHDSDGSILVEIGFDLIMGLILVSLSYFILIELA